MKHLLINHDSIYMIKFRANQNQYLFTSENGVLAEVIRKYNKYGIEAIYIYHSVKLKFVKLSKKNVKSFFDYDTDSFEELKKSKFI